MDGRTRVRLPKRKRLRASDVSPVMIGIINDMEELGIDKMPQFLDRSRWTERDRKRSREHWKKIAEKRRAERDEKDRMIFAKARRSNQVKLIKQIKRGRRRDARDERRARGLRRQREKSEHEYQVLACLREGIETTSRMSKRTGLETKLLRRALKRLITQDKAVKLTAKTYGLADAPKRQRLPAEAKRRLQRKHRK